VFCSNARDVTLLENTSYQALTRETSLSKTRTERRIIRGAVNFVPHLVHTMPEKIQSLDFTLKTHEIDSVHTTPREF